MPKESKKSQTFEYSKAEVQELIMRDLLDNNRISHPCECTGIADKQVVIGDLPRGNFDSDPIYGFGGITINVLL